MSRTSDRWARSRLRRRRRQRRSAAWAVSTGATYPQAPRGPGHVAPARRHGKALQGPERSESSRRLMMRLRSARRDRSRCARNHSYDSITIDGVRVQRVPSRARCAPSSRRTTATRCRAASGTARRARDPGRSPRPHERPGGRDRERPHAASRSRACSTSACSVSRMVPNSAAPTLYIVGPGTTGGAQARVGEVGRVHELVAVAAAAEHEHRRAVSDELEQDRHDPEPAVTEDRAGPDDRDVEARRRPPRGTAPRPAASPARRPRADGTACAR